MKKTFKIYISGSIFHIEEDAFEKLQAYLQLLSQYFKNQAGGQDILLDIESRISELLQEKITGRQEVITSEWVDDIMQRMGKPEDFMDEEEAKNSTDAQATFKGEKLKKRLYRDTENRVLGGVCSGMSAYFNFDPVFLRILFVLLVFVGAGISAIVYLILWMVVPTATTTAQRLEMKGEEATISNIQKTIQEEASEVKKSFEKMGRSESFRYGKDVAKKVGEVSFQIGKRLGRIVTVFFGALLLLIGFFGLIAFLISMIVGSSAIHYQVAGYNPDVNLSGFLGFMVSPGILSLSILLLVLLVGIPLLAVLFVGTKMVFRYKTNNRLIGLGALGIWLAALVVMMVITVGQVGNFSQKSTVSTGKSLHIPSCITLNIDLGSIPEIVETGKSFKVEDFTMIERNGENMLAGNPSLNIESTEAPDFSVIIRKTTRGKNTAEVQKNLEQIDYEISNSDSTLMLDPYFTIGNQAKWRSQEVQVLIRVPRGKRVHLADNLGSLRFDFENANNIGNRDMCGKTWVMTPEGLSLVEK